MMKLMLLPQIFELLKKAFEPLRDALEAIKQVQDNKLYSTKTWIKPFNLTYFADKWQM